ncbi:MAG: type I methionyl aminopeptidase [Lentisphaerae bacterium]|nr:type I methionyl aminopeptidase [Lentisphaerota bacterium]
MAFFRDFVVHTPEEIERIRVAMQMTAQVRDQLVELVRPGMSTLQIDMLAGDLIQAAGGTSGFLNYHGFPGNICISLNDEVVHGIGVANRIVQESDIVSVDIGVKYNGAVGDSAITFGFGELPKDTKRLLTATREALMAGIAAAVKGNCIRDISRAVEKRAMADRLGIVREMVGHGVGIKLHEPPDVPNYVTPVRGPKLVPGMVLAIEPMLNLGGNRITQDSDGWTIRTKDGSLSAHFEHSILITENKPEILTWPKTM